MRKGKKANSMTNQNNAKQEHAHAVMSMMVKIKDNHKGEKDND